MSAAEDFLRRMEKDGLVYYSILGSVDNDDPWWAVVSSVKFDAIGPTWRDATPEEARWFDEVLDPPLPTVARTAPLDEAGSDDG